jgi:hypothetical protein
MADWHMVLLLALSALSTCVINLQSLILVIRGRNASVDDPYEGKNLSA